MFSSDQYMALFSQMFPHSLTHLLYKAKQKRSDGSITCDWLAVCFVACNAHVGQSIPFQPMVERYDSGVVQLPIFYSLYVKVTLIILFKRPTLLSPLLDLLASN